MKNTILLLILFFIVTSIANPTIQLPQSTIDIILYEKKLSNIDKKADDLNERAGTVLSIADSILYTLENKKKVLRRLRR